jgi:addiction module HigA family antidote
MINTGFALNGEMEMPSRLRSSTTTKQQLEDGAPMPPMHPGEMLREEFMKPLGLSANALAIALRVPVTRISEIVRERRGITADTALRLARYFNLAPEFWMRLQMDYDLESAAGVLQDTLRQEIRPRPVAHAPNEGKSRVA